MTKLNKEDALAGVAVGAIGFFGLGCCLGLIILVFASRLILLYGWLFENWYDAFNSKIVAFLGWLFAPWTCLAWMYAYFNNKGQIEGIYLVCIIVGAIMDFSSFFGSTKSQSKE